MHLKKNGIGLLLCSNLVTSLNTFSKEREEFVDEFLYVSKLFFKKTLSKELYLIGVALVIYTDRSKSGNHMFSLYGIPFKKVIGNTHWLIRPRISANFCIDLKHFL